MIVSKILVHTISTLIIIIGGIYVYSLVQTLFFTSLSSHYVEFETLLLQPLNFDTRSICTVGNYTEGPDTRTLASVSNKAGEKIWVEVPMDITLLGTLRKLFLTDSTKPFETTARACGTFEFMRSGNSGYGPNELFKYRITP
jgi:hypothetical protein